MSKQPAKAKSPGPYDPPAKPTQSRKVSQQGGVASKNKFYDGPTVPLQAADVKAKAQDVARTTVAETKRQTRKAVAKAKRHPWSIVSIITTIPFLITLSLFSTVVCPPPSESLSPFSKFVLSPLGLHDASSQHSELHKTLCYPANVYHRDVLEPYIYPVVADLQSRAQAHPIYTKALEPGYRVASTNGKRIWEGPVRPVVEKTRKGIRRAYLTFVEPHLPYLRTKIETFTAPYTSRVAAVYQQYVAPHLNTAGRYTQTAGKSTVDTYKYVAAHPFTGHAGRYANAGYQVSKAKGQQAYEWSKPHAIRGGREAERIAREILGPRVIAGAQYAGEQAQRVWVLIKIHVQRQYYAHLDPRVGPYITKAHTALSPYITLFRTKVYQPYIFPLLESVLPPAVLAPTPPKSFWALIADILPGSHVAERKVDMKQYRDKVDKAQKPAQVPIPGADKVAKAESAQKDTKEAKKIDREEMVRVREAIRERVEKQGKKGYETVRQELLELHTSILSDPFKTFKESALSELERDFEYVLKGLDKLYTASTTLTREQVQKSSAQGDARVAKKVQGVRERNGRLKQRWYDQGKPIVRKQLDALEEALGTEYEDLKQKMAWMDDVNPKDWAQYNSLRDAVEAWEKKYIALHDGESKDRALSAPAANVPRACSSFSTHVDDLFEGWRDQVRLLKKTAYDRIEAREVLAAESSKASPIRVNTATKPADESKVSILPIVEAGAAAAAAGGIIGKGKEQVLDALSQASAAVAGEPTSVGVVDQVKEAVESVYEQASEGVHQATRSALSAVGATPSPESVGEHVESIVNVAGESASAAYDAAGSAVHDATRSILSAVGATPTPENAGEHLESLANVVMAGYASVAENVGDAVHQATRAGLQAVGVTPSPESLPEHLESVASEVSASVSSVALAAAATASSLAEAAGSAVHDRTRAAQRAVGIEPTPDTYAEHVESAVWAASSSIESVASVASEAVFSAVDAVAPDIKADSPQDHAASVAAVASSAAVSAYEQATASAGSVYEAASSGAVEAAAAAAGVAAAGSSAVADQAAALGQQIQQALGLVSTQEPLASTASAYLASLSSAAVGAATGLPDAIASGQSVLDELRSQAGQKVHEATRAASRAAGVRPTPETAGEYLEELQEQVKKVQGDMGEVAGDVRDIVQEQAEKVAEGVKRAVGRDEL